MKPSEWSLHSHDLILPNHQDHEVFPDVSVSWRFRKLRELHENHRRSRSPLHPLGSSSAHLPLVIWQDWVPNNKKQHMKQHVHEFVEIILTHLQLPSPIKSDQVIDGHF